MKITHTMYYFQLWKAMRIHVFIHSFKEHLLNAKYVPFTELSPGGIKIYLVGAYNRGEETHIIKILAIGHDWGNGGAHRAL